MPTSSALSHAQQALWFLHQLMPGSAAYNTGVALGIHSTMDLHALDQAVLELGRRHDMLRSTFAEDNGQPRRFVAAEPRVHLEVRELPQADDTAIRSTVREILTKPFDLSQDGPFRIVLLVRAPDDSVLLIADHHIAIDATSNWVLLRDLFQLYFAFAAHQQPSLPPVKAGYDDYVAAERDLLASARGARLEKYWQQVCLGSAAAELPTDRPRQAGQTKAGATHQLTLAPDQVHPLRDAAAKAGVTLFSSLLGVFQGLIYRYTRQPDFLIGCPTTTRLTPPRREIVGNFINTLVFRARFRPDTTFRQAAAQADEQVKAGLAAVGYPFALLARTAGQTGSQARPALFHITFNLIGTAQPDPLLRLLLDVERAGRPTDYGGLLITPFELPQQEGQHDLAVNVRQSADTLAIDFRYDTDLFEPATIQRLASHFVRALEIATHQPDRPIARAQLMDDDELARLLGRDARDDPAA